MLLLGIAACGSSHHSASSNATHASTNSGSSTTVSPIKVGLICSCTGAFAQADTPKADVYKAWVRSTNASGGINGHLIQLTTENDADVPGTSLSEISTLISDHVDAIVDISDVDIVWAKQVQSAGITNFGIFYCAEAVACQQAIPLLRDAGKALGVPLVYQTSVSATAPNYTAQCVAARQKQVKAIQISDVTQIAQRIGTDCATQNYDPVYIAEGAIYSDVFTTTAGLKNDSLFAFPTAPYFYQIPAYVAMDQAVDKYYPGLRNNPTEWAQQTTWGWPAGELLLEAVKAGGLTRNDTPTPAEIVKGLAALKGTTLDGMSPPLTFTPGQPHSVNCWFTGRVQNGTPQLLDGGKTTCKNG